VKDLASHVPNYINPESLAGTVLAVNIACCTIATTFACIRLFIRIKILHSVGWDDLAAAVAVVSWLFPSESFSEPVFNSFQVLFIVNVILSCMCKYYNFTNYLEIEFSLLS
jgi:hypothetical protein